MEAQMAEITARDLLKQGIKLWFVTSERVRTKAAQLREDLEDVVVEARQEYADQAAVAADQATVAAQPEVAPEPVVEAPPRRKAGRGRRTTKIDAPEQEQHASA
jgi:hypothetical protein